MRKFLLLAFGMALAMGLATAQAQDDQAAGVQAEQARTDIPARGLSMNQVEQRFGAPASRIAAIGQPPIARWVYPSFVVYFEYNLVIHAVRTQTTAANN
jgi:hypothetical protein